METKLIPPEQARAPQPEEPKEQVEEQEPLGQPAQPEQAGENEGEGSRTAARKYDEEATEWARHGDQVEAAAEAAEEALDSSEAVTLRNAELRGKLGKHS